MDDLEFKKALAAVDYHAREVDAAKIGLENAKARVDARRDELANAEAAVADAQAELDAKQADLDAAHAVINEEAPGRSVSANAGAAYASGTSEE